MRTILCIDDDESIWESIRAIFETTYKVFISKDVPQARELLKTERIDLILLDYALPGIDGLAFLFELSRHYAGIPVLMVTANDSEYTQAEALRRGARGRITKPFNVSVIRHEVRSAIEALDAPRVRAVLEKTTDAINPSIIIDSISSQRVVARAVELAKFNAPIFIEGEKGVGKELLARHLYNTQNRSQDFFYVVRCSAEAKDLDRELFGTEEEPGMLHTMTGVIYFDDINRMPASVKHRLGEAISVKASPQAALLIFGGSSIGSFLDGASSSFAELAKTRLLQIPPLRLRPDDIPVLAYRFLSELAKRFDSPLTKFSTESLSFMRAYSWPGNVRELQNVVERLSLIYGEHPEVEASFLPREISPFPSRIPQLPGMTMDQAMESFEKGLILDALAKTEGNTVKAAELLSISPRRIGYAIKPKAEQSEKESP